MPGSKKVHGVSSLGGRFTNETVIDGTKSNSNGPTQTDGAFVRFLSVWVSPADTNRCYVWVDASPERWPDPFRRRAKKVLDAFN